MTRAILEMLRSSEFWLPHNVTWKDVQERPDIQFPNFWELLSKSISLIGLLCLLRYVLIRFVFTKLGTRLNINSVKTIKAPDSKELEDLYTNGGQAAIRDSGRVKKVTEATGLTREQVYKWLKLRRIQDEIPDLDKFVEDCWLLMFETSLCVLGWYCVIGEPKLWGFEVYWSTPFQNCRTCDEWFYLTTIALFVIDSFALAFKKYETLDLRTRIYHHIIVVFIMLVSWTSNEVRLGRLLLFMLEFGAPLAYLGKLSEWLNFPSATKLFFGCFFAYWFIVRVIWLHFVALPYIFVIRHLHVGPIPSYILLDILIALLLVANTIWLILIYRNISKAFSTGEFRKNFKKEINESLNELENAINIARDRKQQPILPSPSFHKHL